MTTTLVLSYTGLLYAIKSGKVTQEMLNDALLYFGCTREHALNKDNDDLARATRDDTAHKESMYDIVYRTITRAEAAGRVAWRQKKESNSFEQLNELLIANGFQSLIFDPSHMSHYNYPTVEDAVAGQQSDKLNVVWRG